VLKTVLDFFIALIALIILSPFLLIIIVVLSFSNKGNPFFVQKRAGYRGRIFNLIKFKTMNDKTDLNGKLLPDKERMTKIGSFVRSTSLDELPQLWNIIKGDMSFIGPRPLPVKYLERYTKDQLRRHEVRPGISGWAQVNGRNSISWEKKFELDLYYVENISFKLDARIFWMTIKKVLFRENVNASSEITMSEFTGTPKK
jgi:undecaprenyl phosphate N,N'-diacetylbacillosamine 1-phosphate transferase